MTAYTETVKAFHDADRDWSLELQAAFGVGASQERYTAEGKGAEGSSLRAAYDARHTAQMAWFAACDAQRATA